MLSSRGMNFTNLFSLNLLAKTIIIGEVPVYWRRGGSATFDLLLQNSSITKQKSIGSFIVTLMNSPITKRCFVISNGSEKSHSANK